MKKQEKQKKPTPGLIDLADAYVAPAFSNLRSDLTGFGEALDAQSILMDMARDLDAEGNQDAISVVDPLDDLPRPDQDESNADLEGALQNLGMTATAGSDADDVASGTGPEAAQAAAEPWSNAGDNSAVPEVSGANILPEFVAMDAMPEVPSHDEEAGFDDEDGADEIEASADDWDFDDLGGVETSEEDDLEKAVADSSAILSDEVLTEEDWPAADELASDIAEADAVADRSHIVSSSEGFLREAMGAVEQDDAEEPASVALNEIFASDDEAFSTELGPELEHGARSRDIDPWNDPDDDAVPLQGTRSAEPASDPVWNDVAEVLDQEEDIPASAEDATWSRQAADTKAIGAPVSSEGSAKPTWRSIYENPPARAAAAATPAANRADLPLQDEEVSHGGVRLGDADGEDSDDSGNATIDDVVAGTQVNGGGTRGLAGDRPDGSAKGRSHTGLVIGAIAACLLAGGAGYVWVKRDSIPALAGILGTSQPAKTAANGQSDQPVSPGDTAPSPGVDIDFDISGDGKPSSSQPFTRRALDEEAERARARENPAANDQPDAADARQAEIDRIAGVGAQSGSSTAEDAEAANEAVNAALTVQAEEIRRLKAEVAVLKTEMARVNSVADNANRQANSMASALVDISRLGEESAANNVRLVELTGRLARVELNDPGSVAREMAAEAAGSAVSRIEARLDDLSSDIGIIARLAVKNNSGPFGGRGDSADLLPLRAAPNVDDGPAPERFARSAHEAPRISDTPAQARAATAPAVPAKKAKAPETVTSRKTFTISNNNAGRVGQVKRGDFVDGYGYVLEIKPVKGGGRMVVMENGSVYVE
jgi:hypothetical protein